jgi:putative hemolysin
MYRILFAATGLATLAACETEPPKPQLANPAATYCIDSGARYEIRDGSDGQYGVCILPDGREVDAWEHFRANS